MQKLIRTARRTAALLYRWLRPKVAWLKPWGKPVPLTQKDFAERILSARKAAGLETDAAAAIAGLTAAQLDDLESGKTPLTFETLSKLAYIYGYDISAFNEERFFAKSPLTAVHRSYGDGVDVAVMRAFVAVNAEMAKLEKLLGREREHNHAIYPFPNPSSWTHAKNQGRKLARIERDRLELADEPIGDFSKFLESIGVRCAFGRLPGGTSGAAFSSFGFGPLVLINAYEGKGRRNFSGAHEYAHLLLDGIYSSSISRTGNQDQLVEQRANAFAGHFLMPEDGLRRLVSSHAGDVTYEDVATAAQHFSVSWPAALRQLQTIGLVNPNRAEHLVRLHRGGDNIFAEPWADLWRDLNRLVHDACVQQEITRRKGYAILREAADRLGTKFDVELDDFHPSESAG